MGYTESVGSASLSGAGVTAASATTPPMGTGASAGSCPPQSTSTLPNFSPWLLQKEQKPQRRNTRSCLHRAGVGGPERARSDSSLGRRPLLTIWLTPMWAFLNILLGMPWREWPLPDPPTLRVWASRPKPGCCLEVKIFGSPQATDPAAESPQYTGQGGGRMNLCI